MSDLERVSLAIEKDLLERFDALVDRGGHQNRSEAIRDLMRQRLVEEAWEADQEEAVATVTLVYDHGKRRLADKLTGAGHVHHHSILATLHVHLDADNCLEVIALKGDPKSLRHIAEHMVGMKGVKHGKIVMSSAAV
jgi:CopG family transcriptional regulator, nickel-responsive regulator